MPGCLPDKRQLREPFAKPAGMTRDARDDADRHYAEIERVGRFIKPRIERAERAYAAALTSIWVGNAGAALATLSFLGATWDKDRSLRVLFWPLGLFVFGLIAMGAGTLYTVISDGRAISR